MAERIVLDPAEVATSRTALDITPWVSSEGIDWGDAEIQGYMADRSRGAAPVDFRVPNRIITVPLALKTMGGTSFAAARTAVQAKASLFQRERGWLKRVAASGSIVFADVVNATLKLGGGWGQAHRGYDVDAQLVLEAQPDFYGAEVTLSDHVNPSGNPELVFTETAIQGDYPARVRIVVDEDDADRQLGLLWGIRSRTYSSAATARLAYVAGTMTPQDTATVAGVTRIQHTTVSTVWTPILSTDIIPTGALTHVGTYRVWALMQGNDATDKVVDVRLLWDVGDLASPVENSSVRIPGSSNEYALDLGEVRLDPAPSGTHRWRGQIQAKAETAPADVEVSRVWIVPVDEGYGVLRAPVLAASSFTTFAARDEFDQTAGALTGKTLPLGGSWTGAGDADDFTLETGFHTIERAAVSDTVDVGRYAIAGATNYTNIAVRADVMSNETAQTKRMGVLARYTSTSLYLIAALQFNGAAAQVRLNKNVGGGRVQVASNLLALGAAKVSTWYSVQVSVDADGRYQVWVWVTGGSPGDPLITGQDSDLATGGAIATGKPGIYDEYNSSAANIRRYNEFVAYVPTQDAVMHPSQSAELRWDGNYREDAAGVGWGPVPFVTGDNPRLPPAGLESRTCEVFIRSSRSDYNQLPDNNFDAFSARMFYRPCWLFVS